MELVEHLTNMNWLKKKQAGAGTAFFPSWEPKLRILLVPGVIKTSKTFEFIFKDLISKTSYFFKFSLETIKYVIILFVITKVKT